MCPGPTAERLRPALLGFVGLCGLAAWCADPAIAQPIPFNHRIHLEKVGLACDNCHSGVLERASATIPHVSFCMACHEGEVTTNPAAKAWIGAIRGYARAGADIPWVRLYGLPRDVFFSHRRHVKVAEIACERCHGKMGSGVRPPPQALVALTMDDCLDCHRERRAGVGCTACHR